jgi:hypothetical protein
VTNGNFVIGRSPCVIGESVTVATGGDSTSKNRTARGLPCSGVWTEDGDVDTQIIVLGGGMLVGIAMLVHMMRRAQWNRELPPVSDQWLAEQRGRREV